MRKCDMRKKFHREAHSTFQLDELLRVNAPAAPDNFDDFWQSAYLAVLKLNVNVQLQDSHQIVKNCRVINVRYNSTDNITIGGWLLVPIDKPPTRGFIVGHGYAGRGGPDFDLPFTDAVIFFPCCRGLGISYNPPISSEPHWHVLHNIDKREQYILKGCVEDIWLAISSMLIMFPFLSGKLGFLGISFTGGIGVLAMAYETRINRAHFNVPTFGHHRLRLRKQTWGSGHAVQQFFKQHPRMTLKTLRYYDAANAAQRLTMPVHFALALKDPVVTPPGQFAIYNNTPAKKQLFVLDEGHSDKYPRKHEQHQQLLHELKDFFSV